MTTKVTSCDLPDGDYPGKWGGYTVTVEVEGKAHQLSTENGVRGMNTPCVVLVKGGKATVETS